MVGLIFFGNRGGNASGSTDDITDGDISANTYDNHAGNTIAILCK